MSIEDRVEKVVEDMANALLEQSGGEIQLVMLLAIVTNAKTAIIDLISEEVKKCVNF